MYFPQLCWIRTIVKLKLVCPAVSPLAKKTKKKKKRATDLLKKIFGCVFLQFL